MISPKAVCLVYFALLFGLTRTEGKTSNPQIPTSTATNAVEAQDTNDTANNGTNAQDITTDGKNAEETYSRAPNDTTNNVEKKGDQSTEHLRTDNTASSLSLESSSSPSSSLKATSQPKDTNKLSENQCIFSLPSGDKLHLIVAVLIVGCLVLLMTTLMCACQVCHLKGLISGLHSRHDNIDLRAVREKSETPQKNKQADGHPTEACLLLSEVTTGQEQSKELEVKIEEVKVEEMEQIGTETPVIGPNGDVNQENSVVPMEKQPESSDKPEV